MLTIRKSAITLGVLGAMIATTATPSLARSKHVRAPATEYGEQAPGNGHGAYAAQPDALYTYGCASSSSSR